MVKYGEWVYDEVPRSLLDEGSTTRQWRAEKDYKAKLESHRELARQNITRMWGPTSATGMMAFAQVDKCETLDKLRNVCTAYFLPITWDKETKTVVNKEEELKLLKTQQAELLKRIERLEFGKWGKEPANGAMFKIEKKFSSGSLAPKYTYVALKAAGVWYLTGTGSEATKYYDWEGLKKFAGQYARVWKLTVDKEMLD